MPHLGAVRRERFLTIDNPLNPPGVGVGPIFFKVRLSIRTCVPNLGAVRSDGAVRRRGPTARSDGAVRRRGPTARSDGAVRRRGPTARSDGAVRRRGPTARSDGAVRRRGPTVKYIIGRKYAWTGAKVRTDCGRADEECDTE